MVSERTVCEQVKTQPTTFALICVTATRSRHRRCSSLVLRCELYSISISTSVQAFYFRIPPTTLSEDPKLTSGTNIKLNCSNYLIWNLAFLLILGSQNKQDILSIPPAIPTWSQLDCSAVTWLLNCMETSGQIYSVLGNCNHVGYLMRDVFECFSCIQSIWETLFFDQSVNYYFLPSTRGVHGGKLLIRLKS